MSLDEPILESPEQVISSFNEHERQVYEDLADRLARMVRGEIRARYEIAQRIHEVYYRMQTSGSLYGQRFLHRLAIALGFKSAGPFREMIQIVDRWPTLESLEKEVLSRIKNISWKKILLIARLEPEEFAECADEISDMTVEELRNQTRTDTAKPGRSFEKLETVEELLRDIESSTSRLKKKVETQWKAFDLKKLVARLEVGDAEIEEMLLSASQKVGELARVLDLYAQELDTFLANT